MYILFIVMLTDKYTS